jgi:hypothetical protein
MLLEKLRTHKDVGGCLTSLSSPMLVAMAFGSLEKLLGGSLWQTLLVVLTSEGVGSFYAVCLPHHPDVGNRHPGILL